jgi:deoxycytidine triphosphate deaminase
VILSGEAIRERLKAGQIFKQATWAEESIMEASYALRIANDGLLIDGNFYDPGTTFRKNYIEIGPGKLAILSTIERLNMPGDLLGKIGIRFDQTTQGLTGLMGIQVDPLFGSEQDDERLFVRVANLGNESIRLLPGDKVFTFEVHEVRGDVQPPSSGKQPIWTRLKRRLGNQNNASWTYITQVDYNLSNETQNIKDYLQPLVMFGVFLVAVTILGVAVTMILSVRDTPEVMVPNWVTDWAWALALSTITLTTLAIVWVGFIAGWRAWRPYRANQTKPRKEAR